MGIFDIIILGVVEGVTEFLPISSTGHLILASSLLGLQQTDFLKSFEIAIQFGAILSVVFLYWKSFFDFELLKKLAVAFLPTAAIGLIAYPLVKAYFIGNAMIVVWTLAIGGTALIVFEVLHKEPEDATADVNAITYRQSLFIGLFQAIAIIPGVSRSAATILGGLLLGISRMTIVEFSFLLAVPTMLAATALDLLKSAAVFSFNEFMMLAFGCIVSFVIALGSIVWLLRFVRTHNFITFGVYRIAIAGIFLLFLLS